MTDLIPPRPEIADAAVIAAARSFARTLTVFIDAQFRSEVLGIYLLGSLAHGGFNRRYSDIDLAIITETGFDQGSLDAIKAEAATLSPELTAKLSIFWSNRQFTIGRFPPLDLIDYLVHRVVLLERERIVPRRPTLQEVRGYLSGSPFDNWAASAKRFATLETLRAIDRKSYLRTLLYPARFIYSWMTGDMGSNDDAVAFLSESSVPGLDVDLVTTALHCRHAAEDPDPLFPLRSALPRQVEACALLMERA